MESCAVALGKHNIRCNSVLPGTIRTPINDDDLANEGKRKYMEGRVPLGRLGEPSDIAGPAVFLASDLAKYSTYRLTLFGLCTSVCREAEICSLARSIHSCSFSHWLIFIGGWRCSRQLTMTVYSVYSMYGFMMRSFMS